ncbi:hypothetical protein ACFL2Z_04055 [Candidatus Eisenbacteria bacterium]|uniref:Phage tail protein n=1 Tax=Eiseniibacteriota bacterium TaxID=2212470 RepID=A0ABV6YPS6_UNCEI
MPSIPNWKEVFIIRRGDEAIVWPPVLIAEADDYITFKTLGVSARIEFPFDGPFEPNNSTHQPTAEKPGWIGVENLPNGVEAGIRVGMDLTTTVKLKADDKSNALGELRDPDGVFGKSGESMVKGNIQVYTYSVFCVEINDHAIGNSSPVIMIEPPQPPKPGGG